MGSRSTGNQTAPTKISPSHQTPIETKSASGKNPCLDPAEFGAGVPQRFLDAQCWKNFRTEAVETKRNKVSNKKHQDQFKIMCFLMFALKFYVLI